MTGCRRHIAPRGALPPDALPTGADGNRRQPRRRRHRSAASSSAPATATAQASSPTVATTLYAVAHRAVLRADVRQNTRQCAPGDAARTPQKGQSAGSPAAAAAAALLRQRRRAPAQWRLLYDASPGATRPGHPSSQKVAEVDTRV